MEDSALFSERQYFRQPWVLSLIAIISGFCVFIFYKQIILHQSVGNNPASDTELIIIILCILLFFSLFLCLRLDTKIDAEGIAVRFFPLIKRQYKWNELSHVYVRKYEPLGEFGGWGIRGSGKNRAVTVSGKMGIQLELNEGRKILIGTKRAEETKIILEKFSRN